MIPARDGTFRLSLPGFLVPPLRGWLSAIFNGFDTLEQIGKSAKNGL
jgi:hypothetical protein